MIRIKIISVLAVAAVLASLGVTAAWAWAPINATADCHTVTITSEGKYYSEHPDQTAVFTSGSNKVETAVHFTDDSGNSIAQVDVEASGLTPGEWTVALKHASDVSPVPVTIPACRPTCPTQNLEITGATPDGTDLQWTIHNPSSIDLGFIWKIKEDAVNNSGVGHIAAGADATVTQKNYPTDATSTLQVKAVVGTTFCAEVDKAYTPTQPTAPPAGTPTPSATTQPTATTQPSATAQPTSTALPAPPTTGQGSNGGDNSFPMFLLAGILTTLVVGGATLALSRKGS